MRCVLPERTTSQSGLPAGTVHQREVGVARCWLLALLLALLSTVVEAEIDPTVELLEAERINEILYFQGTFKEGDAAGERCLGVSGDLRTRRIPICLATSRSFLSDGAVALVYRDFNPLKYTVSAAAAATEDPSYAALVKFTEAVRKLKPTPATTPGQTAADSDTSALAQRKAALKDLRDRLVRKEATEDEVFEELGIAEAQRNARDVGLLILDLEEQIAQVEKRNRLPRLVAALVNGLDVTKPSRAAGKANWQDQASAWIDGATGRAGVATVHAEIVEELAKITARIKETEDSLAEISAIAKESGCAVNLEPMCDNTLAGVLQVSLHVEEALEALHGLETALKGLKDRLEPFRSSSNWIDDDRNYVFARRPAPSSSMETVTVTVIERSLSEDLGFVKVAEQSGQVRLRALSRVVPEPAAGVVWAPGIEVPKYGTAVNAQGQTIVSLASKEDYDFTGALALNLYVRRGQPSWVYFGGQFGITTEKDPGVFVGFVMRLRNGLAIALGGAAAQIADLQTLHVGDVVEGTADIEADLDKEFEFGPYLSIQYSF